MDGGKNLCFPFYFPMPRVSLRTNWEVCTVSAIQIGHVCAICTALNRHAVSVEAAGHFRATLSSFRWCARCNWRLSIFSYSLKYMNVHCNGTDREGRHRKYSWWSSRGPASCCRQGMKSNTWCTRHFELRTFQKTFVKYMCNGGVVFVCSPHVWSWKRWNGL